MSDPNRVVLIDAIRLEIGYMQDANRCADCFYSVERESPMVDRSWAWWCRVAQPVIEFEVQPDGHCKYFTLELEAPDE